jgi:hypothetical protein
MTEIDVDRGVFAITITATTSIPAPADRVVAVRPGRSFTWSGHVALPGLLDGRHTFTVTADADDRSTLVQHERLSGVLTPLLRRKLVHDLPPAFVAANAAVAAQAVS